jgi:hypothetical protein
MPAPVVQVRTRIPYDLAIVLVFAALLIAGAALRQEFLGDGIRHLPAILSRRPTLGEPRWLLFPALATLWIRLLSGFGFVGGVEAALRALIAVSVASGVLFLFCLRHWIHAECSDDRRCAAALLLAGSCAPFLLLFSDIAEPQLAAAIAVAGLVYARIRRDDVTRARAAVMCAILAIAVATLIYQGVILAFGMLPLVVSTKIVDLRRVIIATCIAVLGVMGLMVGAQMETGVQPITAVTTTVRGEHNPLTRSFMASVSAPKYVAAALAGPPQGIVALENFSGLRALVSSLGGSNRSAAMASVRNLLLLMVGAVVTAMLLVRGARDRQWRVLAAAAILLTLPILRNQQYGYVKFYILWPIPVALLATRCRPRLILITALVVLGLNGWLVTEQIRQGRKNYTIARAAYATATTSTCWLTSGWSPPFAYLWPGTATPILGTLATGTDPGVQSSRLTASLQQCFCDSTSVWADTTIRDMDVVRSITSHFHYQAGDWSSVLIDPSAASGQPMPGVLLYPDAARERACRDGVRRGSDRGQIRVRPAEIANTRGFGLKHVSDPSLTPV